ncbi:MAG: hypothetical protein PHI16_06090 [Methanocellales archaeon]|nr:hypothetical protein [Methanocellales archaeon]
MPSCEGCAWRVQYDAKLIDLENAVASFPPRHGDRGLVYDRQEVDDWLQKVKTLVQREQNRRYR